MRTRLTLACLAVGALATQVAVPLYPELPRERVAPAVQPDQLDGLLTLRRVDVPGIVLDAALSPRADRLALRTADNRLWIAEVVDGQALGSSYAGHLDHPPRWSPNGDLVRDIVFDGLRARGVHTEAGWALDGQPIPSRGAPSLKFSGQRLTFLGPTGITLVDLQHGQGWTLEDHGPDRAAPPVYAGRGSAFVARSQTDSALWFVPMKAGIGHRAPRVLASPVSPTDRPPDRSFDRHWVAVPSPGGRVVLGEPRREMWRYGTGLSEVLAVDVEKPERKRRFAQEVYVAIVGKVSATTPAGAWLATIR